MIAKLISFIMPVYNNEELFPRAVASILNQKSESIELIIVDDGSTDMTGYLADEIATNDERVKVIHQKNQWIYASFNNGINAAKGEYIYIVNSDDELYEGAISLFEESIERYNEPDVIWTKVIKYDYDVNDILVDVKDLSQELKKTYYFSDINSKPQDWMDYVIKNNFMVNQANLYKRELMIKHPFRNDVFGADVFFNFSISKEIKSCVVLSNPVYKFNKFIYQDKNVSGRYYEYQNRMFNEIYDEEIAFLRNKDIYNGKNVEYFAIQRKRAFTYECRLILGMKNWSSKQKLNEIFLRNYHDMLDRVFFRDEDREEFEARVLFELRKYFIDNPLDESSDYYFAFKIVDILSKYEKTDDELIILKESVYSENNPNRIGEVFLGKIGLNILG